jgi:DNA-binding IscR family transcriptional regulator
MQTLGKHGLIESKRGRIGGAKLRKRKITLLDIWNVTCGQIDTAPAVPALKKPLKTFSDALSKVVVCK